MSAKYISVILMTLILMETSLLRVLAQGDEPTGECPVDLYGPQCNRICNCVIGATCDRNSGDCICTPAFLGALCDKDALMVSLVSSIVGPLTDVADWQEQVDLFCIINLPDNDVTVVITNPSNTRLPRADQVGRGTYRVTLTDIHPGDSGVYRCDVTTTLYAQLKTRSAELSLVVNCANDFYGPDCDMRCNCATGGTCDQTSGVCSCTPPFDGAVCDKDNLAILAVISDPPNPVPDSESVDNVMVRCQTNLPEADVSVGLLYPGSTAPLPMTFTSDGWYERTLTDVHAEDSGEYSCVVTPSGGVATAQSAAYQLAIIDASDSPCAEDPCLNGGRCFAVGQIFLCVCVSGFTGFNCGARESDCESDFYGPDCDMRCNCVTGATCDQDTGNCSCIPAFPGAVCDKDELTVSLTSSSTVVVAEGAAVNLSLICTINLPDDDVAVTITETLGGNILPHNVSDGEYTATLESVNPANPRTYRCAVVTNINGTPTVTSDDHTISFKRENDDVTPRPGNWQVAVIGVISALGIVLVIAVIACGLRMRMKHRVRNSKSTDSGVQMRIVQDGDFYYEDTAAPQHVASTVEEGGLPLWASRWRISWNNLVVEDRILGRGNFGEVRSGTVAIGGKTTRAAIKILTGDASVRDKEDFMDEFRTMTSIGQHPNVVSLLGACQYADVLYVALEYLPLGNLRRYLRMARSQSESDEGALSSYQLVKLALDVAKGMEHLASTGIIHRDLAARNILLGQNLIAKVSDFGLSRGEDIYVQTSSRRVPTRWLAIESLTRRTYTTKSDVWSFGILLWEIATLGGTPYPAIRTESLVAQLQRGYRMTKPTNCDAEIYALMLRCWDKTPQNRPSFTDLVSTLRRMNDSRIEHTYMAVDFTYRNFAVIRPELDDN